MASSQSHMAPSHHISTPFQDNHNYNHINMHILHLTPHLLLHFPCTSTTLKVMADHTAFHGSATKPSSSKDEESMMEPGKLLEESWFFGNLLDKNPNSKKTMLRSFSDPCTSLNFGREVDFAGKSYEETYESIQKLPKSRPSGLIRSSVTVRECDLTGRRRSNNGRKSSRNLNRAPSLPIRLEMDEFHDEEMEFSMGNLIRQASLNDAETMTPKTRRPAKGISRSCSMSSHQSRMKPSMKFEGGLMNQLRTQKSLSDLESEELQGFKDLGFDLDKKDLSPDVISIIPGLQEKCRTEEDGEKSTRRPYLSEAWGARSSAPPVPRWGGKRSTDEIKTQIKFWARAVASNVHQEC